MNGKISGIVVRKETSPAGHPRITLAGLTTRTDGTEVQFYQLVTFKGPNASANIDRLTVGEPALVHGLLTYESWTSGERKLSAVVIVGLTAYPLKASPAQIVRQGERAVLRQAVNTFTLRGNLVKPSSHRETKVGTVTEARVAVKDQSGRAHYFEVEAWREQGLSLQGLPAGAAVELDVLSRKDRWVDGQGKAHWQDVNEVRCALALDTTPAMAQAAD